MRSRQVCVVVGYAELPCGTTALHLACGKVPDYTLRYAGSVHLPSQSTRTRTALVKGLKALHAPAHPPGVQSPLPEGIQLVAPAVLVEVTHRGWSAGGRMCAVELVAIHPMEHTASRAVKPAPARLQGTRASEDPGGAVR
jgi:hypothetical protein